MQDNIRQQKLSLLSSVFTPAAPIIARDLFFGRIDQIKQVVETINERGQHGVLYGERGVGKTSLANILNVVLRNVLVAKVSCSRTDTFKDLWEKIFKRVSFVVKTTGVGFNAVDSETTYQYNLFLPKEQEVAATDILAVFEHLQNPVLFIFDEYDSVHDSNTRLRFADTIKALSDNAPHVTVLLVGIAQSVTELVGAHPSNERCLRQIKLPRMSATELTDIVDNGLTKLEMTIDPFVKLHILDFSQGFPHYTHLLSKYSAKIALESNSLNIDRQHFGIAIEEAIENVQESIRDSYHHAVMTSRTGTMFGDVLAACALAKEDEHGTFRATDLEVPLFKITGAHHPLQAYTYHLGKLSDSERGSILKKIELGKQHRYRFNNPLLRAYVRLKLYQSGKLEEKS